MAADDMQKPLVMEPGDFMFEASNIEITRWIRLVVTGIGINNRSRNRYMDRRNSALFV